MAAAKFGGVGARTRASLLAPTRQCTQLMRMGLARTSCPRADVGECGVDRSSGACASSRRAEQRRVCGGNRRRPRRWWHKALRGA
eukprot:6203383-Pleurochrysis_carterae.AAC.5